MVELITIPLKKPSDVDLTKSLKSLISSAYSDPEKKNAFNEKIAEFNKLREKAIWKCFEKFESSLELIYSYYDQLNALETKVSANEFQQPFKWKDAFDKGTIFGGRASLTLSSLAFEKVCVLFNIAALQSAVAASQSFDSDEGLKTAAKLFQQSAGIFSQLKSMAPAAIPQEPTPDLSPDTLNVLANLMLAQAQEIFVVKAIKDNMKDLVVAKLANQCEDLYSEVLKAMQKDNLKTLWDKEWIPIVAGKQAGFHGITMLYQSLVDRSSKRIGNEIARLQKAIELFKAAQTRSGKITLFDEYAKKSERHLVEAKKDNDFIYNAPIADINTLENCGKAQLAKFLPITAPMNPNFKDLFVDLVPVALNQAMMACDSRRHEIVNGEILKLRDSTQSLNGILASLNLPACIETTASGAALPPSLLEKANDVREKGGVESIRSLISELPEALNRNKEILDEAERMLNEERDSDNQLRSQFKERWTRTPSDKLTEMFRSNCEKYRSIINNAVTADKTVREKFEKNLSGIEMLSKPIQELHSSIPSAAGGNFQNCSSAQKLKQLMEQVETIKRERDTIESDLKSATVDMKDEFLRALQQDGAINEPALSISQIGKVLGPLQQQVNESISKQESLVQNIQMAHSQFTKESGSGTSSRDTLLTELAKSYDAFSELQHNLKEGTKFYNDLTQLLIVFQSKIADFVFARKN
jgi:programmed cell death 6-interacting protein